MRCDGSPDPSNHGEINTFLTLWKEDKENNDINSSIKNVILALDLIQELQLLINDLDNQEISEKEKIIEQHRHVR
jgi:hypothetical protein